MTIVSAFLDLWREPSADRDNKRRLNQARVELAEAEIGVEDYTARRDKLKVRVARLEAELKPVGDSRPARASIQAPHPGTTLAPGQTSRQAGETMSEWIARTQSKRDQQHAHA